MKTYAKYENYTQDPINMTRSYASPGCWGTAPADVPRLSAQQRGSYSGESHEDYYKLKDSGVLIPMTRYAKWDETSAGSMSISAQYDNGSACQGTITCSNVAWNLQGADPGTELIYKMGNVNENALLLSAIGNSVPRLDVLTSAAEFPKTWELILGMRKRAVGLINQLRRKGWKALPEAASDTWLEWRYGWRLLGFEIEAVNNAVNNPLKSLFVEGRSGESFGVEYTAEGDVFPLLHFATRASAFTEVLHQHDVSVRANVNGRVRLQSANVLVSPVVTGWELIPFSFVLDWFVNVGDVLSSWKALQLADYTCSIGVKRKGTLIGRVSSTVSYDGAYTSVQAVGSSDLTVETMLRWPRNVPKLTPAVNVDLTTARSLDIAALLKSTSTSLRR